MWILIRWILYWLFLLPWAYISCFWEFLEVFVVVAHHCCCNSGSEKICQVSWGSWAHHHPRHPHHCSPLYADRELLDPFELWVLYRHHRSYHSEAMLARLLRYLHLAPSYKQIENFIIHSNQPSHKILWEYWSKYYKLLVRNTTLVGHAIITGHLDYTNW